MGAENLKYLMKASVLKEYRKIEWMEVANPVISGNEILVKVKFASICGSDQHIFLGEFHPRTKLPLIPGHEFSGEVYSIGPEVNKYKVGDRVAVDPIIWCGNCPACLIGHYPACTSLKLIGVDLNGGFAEYVKVSENMLFPLPPELSDKHAALVEVLSIGFHACNRAAVMENDTIVIWGAGKVGQCIMQAARTKTTNTLIMVDILDSRLDNAKRAYPDILTINALSTDPVPKIIEITRGNGVDVAFESVGHTREYDGLVHPVRGCIQSIRGAGTVCVLGLSDQPAELLMKELIWKEARIVASRVTHGEFTETIAALRKGLLKPDSLITDVFTPDKAQHAFEILEKEPEKHLKILLKFS
jgi:threonine dehydrogenase-like Zn-dependent dehydrogenase